MHPRRIVFIGSAWLLTAVAAFSLGRLGSPSGSSARNAQVTSAPSNSAPTTTSSDAAPAVNDDTLAAWFGSHATGLDQVLGGRTLAEHVKHLLKQDDEALRMLGFLRLLEALDSPDDLKAVLDVIAKDSNGRYRMTEQAMLLQKWAKLSAKDAAAYANGLRDWSKFNGLNAVLKTWVKDSPEAAIAWAVENGAPTDGKSPDPRAGEEGNWAVATLLGSLAKTNLDRAIEIAANQPYSRARGRMMDTVISELIAQRGDDAARTAMLELPDDTFRASMAGRLADRLAGKDPQGAAQWANGLPAGETRQRALGEVVSQWAEKDPVAAGNYLTQFGASPDLDRARQEYAQRVVRNDPEGAMAWAQAITDEQRRSETTQGLLSSWLRRDQAAALAWSQANGVQLGATQPGARSSGRFSGRR